MNVPRTLGIFPNNKLTYKLKVLSVNRQDPVGESFVKGIVLWRYYKVLLFISPNISSAPVLNK